MKLGTPLRIAAGAAAGLLMLTGCAQAGTGASPKGTVSLGFLAELSGAFQAFGIPAAGGMQLAVKQVNDRGGFDVNGTHYTLNLVSKDDATDAPTTTAFATGFVRDDGIKFVFGALGKLAPLVVQITDPAKVLYFTSSTPASQLAGKPGAQYMFTTIPTLAPRASTAVAGLTAFYPDAKRVVLLGEQIVDNQVLFPEVKKDLEAKGLTVVDQQFYATGTVDFSGILTTLKRDNPDVIFVGSSTIPTVTAIITQNEQLKATSRWFAWGVGCEVGTSAKLSTPFASAPLVGVDLVNSSDPKAIKYLADYRAALGSQPPNIHLSEVNYDFVFMLVQAMEKAGTVTDTDAIAKALRSISYTGLVGKITYDSINESQYGLDVCLVQNGTITDKHFSI